MDRETLDLLEFERVLEIIEDLAETTVGKAVVRQLHPYEDPDLALNQLNQVSEASLYITRNGRVSCAHLGDLRPIFDSLETSSSILSPPDLLSVLRLLQFVSQSQRAFETEKWPVLAEMSIQAVVPPELVGRLSEAITEKGEIRESAFPELAKARKEQGRFRQKAQDHLGKFLNGSKAKYLIPEPYITERAERYVIPVRVEHQSQIPGIVHGASSSGATVFIEPLSAVEFNNQCTYYRELERDILQRILIDLTQSVRSQIENLQTLLNLVAWVDAVFACAAFSLRFRCTAPELVSDRSIKIVSGRHPLLLQSLGREAVVPLSLELDSEENVLAISGPNNGGKTVALKTVGLFCAMAEAGLPVPAEEAELPILKDILADVGDHQSIIQHLSTFSSHVKRINELMDNRKYPCLLLLDEAGRGTDPSYGAALAVSIIEYFRNRETLVIVTTHHRAVKAYASSAAGVKNASFQLDDSTLQPTYVLEFGVAGSSSGFEIAEQLGMKKSIIAHARSLLEKKELQVETYLVELRNELQALQRKESEFIARSQELERKGRELEQEAHRKESRRHKEFERLVKNWGAEFRSEANRYLKRMKDRFAAAKAKEETKKREAALKEAFRRRMKLSAAEEDRPGKTDQISVGDTVYLSRFDKRGVVLNLHHREAQVEISGKKIITLMGELEKVTTGEMVRKPSERVTLNIVEDSDPELNLIGATVEDASGILDKFLDRAFVSGLKEVRVIHGFGTGRLKSAISAILEGHPQVENFQTEGGSTKVTLGR
jgi:DNA mismatch repair protein MutS2